MKNYIKKYILEKLDEQKGRALYACDLAIELYNDDNLEGTLTHDREKSHKFIHDHSTEYAYIIGYWKAEGGGDEFANRVALNFFNTPEHAHCILVFTYVDAVMSRIMSKEYKGKDIWSERIEIDDDMLAWIKRKLDAAIDNAFEALSEYGNPAATDASVIR